MFLGICSKREGQPPTYAISSQTCCCQTTLMWHMTVSMTRHVRAHILHIHSAHVEEVVFVI